MEVEEELEKQPAHHKQDKVAYNRPDYREGKQETRVTVCFSVPTVFIVSCPDYFSPMGKIFPVSE